MEPHSALNNFGGNPPDLISQEISVEILIDQVPFGAKKIETENTNFGKVDVANITVVPESPRFEPPEYQDDVWININGERVYTGFVGDLKPKEDGSYEVTCFNKVRKLKTTTTNVQIQDEYVNAKTVLENDVLLVTGISDYEINIDSSNAMSGSKKVQVGNNQDVQVNFEATNVPAISVVERLAKYTNSVWWISADGTFKFGSPETFERELTLIKNTTAGITTPAYRGVKVIASGQASRSGSWKKRCLIPAESLTKTRAIKPSTKNGKGFKLVNGELREPVFTYRDKSIQTERQANMVANAIANKLARQTKQGEIDIVGDYAITPFDVVEVPESMGGEKYLVQGIKHTIDTSNGFTSKVMCGGLISTS